MFAGFSKVTMSSGMKAIEELNLDVYVVAGDELVPYEGSSDELVFENAIYLKVTDLEELNSI